MLYPKVAKIFFLVIIISFALWKLYIFLLQNSCLDLGNVWDYDNNICRDDCLAWNHLNGCIKITNDEIKLFKNCKHKVYNCISDDIYKAICLRNNLPQNKTTGECDMEFTIDKCNKLEGNWIYPEVCKQ